VTRTDLDCAIGQIIFSRKYTQRLLDATDLAEWLRQPTEGVTHIAWQVGHLAMAEYRLALERIRGRLPGDEQLISDEFLALFGRDSTPEIAESSRYPPAEEIRAVFDRVHEQTLRELPDVDPATLAEPPTKPHSLAHTKLASLLWCAQHEMVHAGQIGLLRRLLGHRPLW
jgi:uncharacterized damage-inducible protein DinB